MEREMQKDPVTSMPGSAGSTRASDQLREHGATVREDLRELGRLTKNAAGEKLAGARRSAQDYYQQGREKAVDLERGFENYVRQNPLKSVLMATGAGIVIGFLMSRR